MTWIWMMRMRVKLEKKKKKNKKKKERRKEPLGRTLGSATPGAGRRWTRMSGVTSKVDIDRLQLGPRSLQALDSQVKKQTEMRLCLLPAETDSKRFAGLLLSENGSNLLEHFKSHHPKPFAWMEKSRAENDDMTTALANSLHVHQSRGKRNMKQLNLAKFAKRAKQDGMEPGAIKEIAHALKIVGA